MKLSNILLCILFAFGATFSGFMSIRENNGTIAAFSIFCTILFICAFNLLLEDVKINRNRRRKRAEAVKMAGYERLRGAGWMKVVHKNI